MSVKTVVLDAFHIRELNDTGETISDGVSIVFEFESKKPERLKELQEHLRDIMVSYHPETYLNDKIWDKFGELKQEIQKEADQSLLKKIKANGDTK